MPINNFSSCFVLFDDCNATEGAPRSRLYTGCRRILTCESQEQLPALLADVESSALYAVVLLSYEFGAATPQTVPCADTSLARVLLFENCHRLSAHAVAHWLATHADAQPSGVADVQPSLDAEGFEQAIVRIKNYIVAGDVYQVNFTYRLRFDAYGAPIALYQRLRARQPVPYGALIALPDGSSVLSFSPELFLRHTAGQLIAQPMKGTAPTTGNTLLDATAAAALATDEKNRAENVMIVDLLRNDLSKVAAFGTVAVPALFEVDRFGEVLQMTSTVTATLRDGVTLSDIVDAVFPCGSITGAPKQRAMQIIRELETTPRGIYTGAIGWVEQATAGTAAGDFCWSVPIRTLVLAAPDTSGVRRGTMGIGAGIVHDSVAADELAECRLKAHFLTGLSADFSLFETMAVSRRDGCVLLERHLQRLAQSARYFHFALNEAMLREAIQRTVAHLPDAVTYRLRLQLNQNGRFDITTTPLTPLTIPAGLLIAPDAMQAENIFLRHKTTQRARYDAAWKAAEAQDAFDMLFCNQYGEVTEGARSNIFVLIDGCWMTPPLAAGVLPGVMRARLLADASWNARERSLTLDQVRAAQAVVMCNALRGVIPARLMT